MQPKRSFRKVESVVFATLSAALIFATPGVVVGGGESFPVASAAPRGGSVAVVPVGATKLARVTGQTRPGETVPNPNQTDTRYAVAGTDLGIIWDGGDGRCLIVFGDTYGAGWGGFGGGPAHADWRSNVLAFSSDRNPHDGLSFEGMTTDRPKHAAEILSSLKIDDEEHTVIPTAGLSVGRRQIVHYMSVNSWPLNRPWLTNYGGLAYSDNGGRTWIKARGAIWRNDSHNRDPFQMAALVKEGGWVYFFGTAAGRQGAVYLARVPQARVLQKSAYVYWNGADFHARAESEAQPIVPGPVSELSIAYNRHFGRWLMTYLSPQRDAIVLRDAPALTGPWTGEKIVLRGVGFPGIYGGFIHPWFNGGEEMYWMLSEWPLYNVSWMRSGLVAAPADEAGNLLSDAGFEDDISSNGLSAPWQLEGEGGRDRGLAHGGRNNAFLRHNKSGWNRLAQTVAVRPGQRYRFTAWVRTSPNHRGGAVGVRSLNGIVLSEKSFANPGVYTLLAFDFTPDRHTTQLQIFVGLRVLHNQDTWLQIDDLKVIPVF